MKEHKNIMTGNFDLIINHAEKLNTYKISIQAGYSSMLERLLSMRGPGLDVQLHIHIPLSQFKSP